MRVHTLLLPSVQTVQTLLLPLQTLLQNYSSCLVYMTYWRSPSQFLPGLLVDGADHCFSRGIDQFLHHLDTESSIYY